MPVLQVTAENATPRLRQGTRPLVDALAEALERPGPVIIMTHGYKFSPGHRVACPHRHILSLSQSSACWKARSWPRELGFGSGFEDEGLGIGFGWHARSTIWRAYTDAAPAGLALARLIGQIHRLSPGRALHLFCHSLGARVALAALHHLPRGAVRRAILLNPAEFGSTARSALATPAGRSAEVVNITSRENDLFDFMLERLVRAPHWGERALGMTMPHAPNTLSLQLDHRETLDKLSAAGFPIGPPRARICHWSAYLRPGVFSLYRALLRTPGDLSLAQLRAALPAEPDPRWSRLLSLPDLPIPLPSWRGAEL